MADVVACVLLVAIAIAVLRVFWLMFAGAVARILGEDHGCDSEGHQEDTSVDQEPGR